MRLSSPALLLTLYFVAAPAWPVEAASVRSVMYGPWSLSCMRSFVAGSPAHCTISLRSPPAEENPSVVHMNWELRLDASGSSVAISRGRSRTTCRPMQVTQDVPRYYRLTDATIAPSRMEEFGRRAHAMMQSHIPFFGDCPSEGAEGQDFPASLLYGSEADLVRAVVAAETRLRDPTLIGSARPGGL